MTYDEAMQFWFGRINYEHKTPRPTDLNLDRIRELLTRLGKPQNRYPIVHVAGSKGKGSTSAMTAAVLRAAGYCVGLFTSPHLVSIRERIQVDGECISEREIADALSEIARASAWHYAPDPGEEALPLNESLTFFEIATALGFLHFAKRKVQVAVIEVGMGGRFDSTNVCLPAVSVITSISFDHTRQLGNTLGLIAGEKAGIIKPGRPTISGVQDPEPREVIQQVCRERGSPLRQIDVDFRYEHAPARLWDDPFRPARVAVITTNRTWPWFDLNLIGEHQAANAAVVVATVECLRELGFAIPDQAIARGLATVVWPGRLECLSQRPLILLDCAHNIASAHALLHALDESCPRAEGARRFLIFAGSRDKDLTGMLALLAPRFERVYLTQFSSNPRAVPADELMQMADPRLAERMRALPCSADALWDALSQATPDDLICIAGSVFLVGELRPLLQASPLSR